MERLQTALNGLGLKAVEARYRRLARTGVEDVTELCRLSGGNCLSCEVDARRSRYLRARSQLAHLPFVKLSISSASGFNLRLINARSASCAHCGSGGVGKTDLSVALAEAAIQSGFGAYFMTAHDLVTT
jgi:DNA replication protein DnaC